MTERIKNRLFVRVTAAVVGTCCAGLWPVTDCSGQTRSRSRVRLREPGRLQRIGRNSDGERFRDFSYGLGGLQRSTGTAGGNVLRSSIRDISRARGSGMGDVASLRRNMLARRSGNPLMRPVTGRTSRSGLGRGGAGAQESRIYSTRSPARSPLAVPGDDAASRMGSATGPLGAATSAAQAAAMGAAEAYLDIMAGSSSSSLKEGPAEITSLVPSTPGRYRTHMESAERAFRLGDFETASEQFQMAGYISPRAPENLLSMVHVKFALSRFSYAQCGYYLRMTLRYFPELPLVNLNPKGFYGRGDALGQSSTYGVHLLRLEGHLDKMPGDADGQLLLAYLHWFSQDTAAARKALSEAMSAARKSEDEAMLEAIDTFWVGAVASGRVSGTLEPSRSAAPPASKPTEESPTPPAGP